MVSISRPPPFSLMNSVPADSSAADEFLSLSRLFLPAGHPELPAALLWELIHLLHLPIALATRRGAPVQPSPVELILLVLTC